MAVLKRQLADGTYEVVEFYNKIIKVEETFIATEDNTSVIKIKSPFSKLTDVLSVYFQGLKLFENEGYTIALDGNGIVLKDWTIKTGEKIYIEIFKTH